MRELNGNDFDRNIMEPNAESALKYPIPMVAVLAAMAGAMDAVGFQLYGVFTANQAGNLVLFWVRLTTNTGVAALSLFSLAGCAVGVVAVVILRTRFSFFATPRGSRALLYLAALLLVVTVVLGARVYQPLLEGNNNQLPIGSTEWWAGALSTSTSAMSLAILGTIFVVMGTARVHIISGTSPFVDSVRYSIARALTGDASWNAKLKTVIFFPIAWFLGAAIASLTPVPRGVIATACALIVCLTALLSRRVGVDS
jgi:uncharacterized membrane protein YoaK (UPF0700 family)